MIEDVKEISIDELSGRDWLSVRAVNICHRYGLLTLTQILTFYKDNGSFIKLHNCGKKTEMELTLFCQKYQVQIIDLKAKDKQDSFAMINELNPLKRATLNRHVEYLISNLNVRAQKGLIKISKTGSVKEVLEVIYIPDFQFTKIKNIGERSVKELKEFMDKISIFLLQLNKLQNEELSKEYAKLLIKTTFKGLQENFETEIERLIYPSGKIKLFRLLNLLIESDQIFTKNKKRIFISIYSTPNIIVEPLESVADELNLTRERIRQLKTLLNTDIQNHFNFISKFILDDFVSYEIETLRSFKIIDKTFSDKINLNEDVNFNILFYSIILGIFFEKTHSVLGDPEIFKGKKKSKGHKRYKCIYFISKYLFEFFKFEQFVDNINIQLNDRITESYSLHFEGFLLQFLNEDNKHLLKEITPICETIILNEFDLVVNFDGFLIFERNTKKPLSQYVLEILETNGSIMKVEEVFEAIIKKYPDLESTEQSVRAILQREKELFIYFGRSSTYGLKKWELEQADIKGGTIRDIVVEFLEGENEPKHISEILKYVQRYRTTNEKSVMTNIGIEESNRFQFFNGDFVGLNTKTYGFETRNYKRIIGSHFMTKMLAKFNGVDLEKVIEHYVSKYSYTPIQVRYLIEKKATAGDIQITIDNKLKV